MDTFGKRLKKIRNENRLRQKDISIATGLAQVTIDNYEHDLRCPDSYNLIRIADYLNISLDCLLCTNDDNLISPDTYANLPERPSCEDLLLKYTDCLMNENSNSAQSLIKAAFNSGFSVQDIYLRVLHPALIKIYDKYVKGELSKAQKHFCSELTHIIMSSIPKRYSLPNKIKIVTMSIHIESLDIGLMMISDFLEMDGYDVSNQSFNSATSPLLETIRSQQPHLLILSATTSNDIEAVINIINRLKSIEPSIKIIVVGRAFSTSHNLWKDIGADGYGNDAKETLAVANNLMMI